MTTNRRGSFIKLAFVIAAAAATAACDGSNPANGGGVSQTGPTVSDSCPSNDPNEGCPCTDPTATVSCGKVIQQSGTYVTCSEGTRACNGTTWGDCIGSYTSTQDLSTNSLSLQGLNPSAACVNNPCDPYCNAFTDNSSGLTADPDAGLTISDGGIALTGVPVPVTSCTGISVTPNTAPTKDLVVTSMTPSPNSVQYTASVLPSGCFAGTPTFLWSIDKYDLAAISNTGKLTLATPIAGPITVSAYAGTLSSSVVCNVSVNVVDTSSAPTGYTNAQFPVTTGTADSIQVLYPYPATVLPLGLPAPLIQWQNNNTPATVASAVKVTLRFPSTGTPIFSWSEIVPELQTAPTPTLAAQPRAVIPQTVWSSFEQTVVRNSGSSGGDAVFAIQRYVSGALRAEVPTTFHFANGQLKGSIFYNSYGTNLVANFGNTKLGKPFGAATLQVAANGTTPTVVVGYSDSTLSGAGCRVCHNAAAGGTKILSNAYLSQGSSGSGTTETSTFTYNPSLATPSLIQGSEALVGSTYATNTFTYAGLSPDGTYLMTSAAPVSANAAATLYTVGGTKITSNLPTGLHAATPVFSNDAQHVAFNFYSGSASPLSTAVGDGKSMAMMDFTAPGTFSNFRKLYTPTSLYSVWPTFLPPGQNGIVFQNSITYNSRDWAGTRSNCDGTGVCNNIGATAEMWWVSTGTTPTAAKLTNLNGGSYMPRGALQGTMKVTSASTSVTTTSSQVGYIVAGAQLVFASQPGVYYIVSSVNATTIVLTAAFTGTTTAATTATANYHGTSANDGTYYEEVYNFEPAALPVTIGGYSWVAFTSRRLYGNVATTNPWWSDPRYQDISAQPTAKKIWVAAISNNPTPGADPSFPAFYLPGQELLAGNSRAYFTLAACEAPGAPTAANLCTSNLDCCGASSSPATAACQLDQPIANPPTSHCVSTGGSTCSADGATCTSDAQCCNFGSGSRCGSGKCGPAPPILTYNPAVYTSNYTATCASGSYPAWRFFYWQAVTPTGTSIAFTAETSINGTSWGAPVAVGTAVPPSTTTWTSGTQTVDDALRANGQKSQTQLMIIATLNPDSSKITTPSLTNWQVTYDCVPSE